MGLVQQNWKWKETRHKSFENQVSLHLIMNEIVFTKMYHTTLHNLLTIIFEYVYLSKLLVLKKSNL